MNADRLGGLPLDVFIGRQGANRQGVDRPGQFGLQHRRDRSLTGDAVQALKSLRHDRQVEMALSAGSPVDPALVGAKFSDNFPRISRATGPSDTFASLMVTNSTLHLG